MPRKTEGVHQRLGGARGVFCSTEICRDGVDMEWPGGEGDMLSGGQSTLGEQKDRFVGTIGVSDLFHQFAAANDNCGVLAFLGLFVVRQRFVTLLQVSWDDEFQLPSALLPQVIYAGYPTSGGVGT